MGTNIFLHLSTEMDNFCVFLMRSQGTSKETRKAQLTKTFGFYVLGPKVIPEVRDNREIRGKLPSPTLRVGDAEAEVVARRGVDCADAGPLG